MFKKRQKNREASKDRKRKENGKFSISDGLHPDEKTFHPDDKSFHPDEIPHSIVKDSILKNSIEKDKEIPGFSAKNPVVETDLLKDLPGKAFPACSEIYQRFIVAKTGVKPKFETGPGKFMKKIIACLIVQMKSHG